MYQSTPSVWNPFTARWYRWILAFFWISGLFAGISAYCRETSFSSYWIKTIVSESASPVSLLCMNLFLFLFSAFAIIFSVPAMLLPLVGLKACLWGFVSIGILHSFGCAGWFLRWTILFSSCCVIPVLYLFWLRSLHEQKGPSSVLLRAVFCGFICLGICYVDYGIISPYLACLIDFQKG